VIRSFKWISLAATTVIVILLAVNVGRESDRRQQALAEHQAFAIADATDLYANNCVQCHGAAGEGLGVYRALDQEFIVNKAPRELFTVIHYGRYATDMAAFGMSEGGNLTPAQIDNLVIMLQYGSWDAIEARVAELGLTPTEDMILAASRSGASIEFVQAAFDADARAMALRLFSENCVECHGEEGQGTADAPELNNPYVQGMPVSQLFEKIALGVRNTKMEGFEQRLTQDEIAALIQLLQTWGDLDGTGPAEFVIATEEEIASVTETGQQLFEMWCAVCHGVRGEGGSIAPSLNDIPRLPVDFIASRVRNGQNAMPPFPEASLSNGQLAVTIEYAQANIIGTGLPVFTAEQLASGEALYGESCAECHGPVGEGVLEQGPRISTLPPMRAVEIINFTRVGSAQTPAIPSSEVSDADLRLIVAYIHSLAP
jgi:mono/diheme cytochrome c family protein